MRDKEAQKIVLDLWKRRWIKWKTILWCMYLE
jgi:hypothetical protein